MSSMREKERTVRSERNPHVLLVQESKGPIGILYYRDEGLLGLEIRSTVLQVDGLTVEYGTLPDQALSIATQLLEEAEWIANASGCLCIDIDLDYRGRVPDIERVLLSRGYMVYGEESRWQKRITQHELKPQQLPLPQAA